MRMMRRALIVLAVLAAVSAQAAAPVQGGKAGSGSGCRALVHEEARYTVCRVDLRTHELKLFLRGQDGEAFGSLTRFVGSPMARGVTMAMNAGMYHEDLSPVGLLVEGGVERAPAELRDGEGNFFLKPNGVLSIRPDGTVSIMETGAYLAAGLKPASATQSGPMLVIGGEIHPKFMQNGTSRWIRNGAGIRDPHTLLLAISLEEVSLGSFARLFRDELGCADALFFDGVISAMSNGSKTLLGGRYPVGPIISVRPRGA